MPADGGRFATVFDGLRGMLGPHGRRMHTVSDDATTYAVDMAPQVERDPTTWFGGVRLGKAYVSYYLMPVYVEPALLASRRRSSAACRASPASTSPAWTSPSS